jgi:mono/diheme cytochrome c family protein
MLYISVVGACSSDSQDSMTKPPLESTLQKADQDNSIEAADHQSAADDIGEQLFKKHCITCHKNGGNILNKEKPIGRASLASRGITTPEEIEKVMRNPGPKMIAIDESKIPDTEAIKIGEYILRTFE